MGKHEDRNGGGTPQIVTRYYHELPAPAPDRPGPPKQLPREERVMGYLVDAIQALVRDDREAAQVYVSKARDTILKEN